MQPVGMAKKRAAAASIISNTKDLTIVVLGRSFLQYFIIEMKSVIKHQH
jgi:hypothetical protein